jgi:lysophospholipid acyltransferase (LPLAT)-like uncharacterized protein
LTTEGFIVFLYHISRIYSATFRLVVENEKEWVDYLRKGNPVLLCTWHQQFFAAIRHFQAYRQFKPSIMISQSRDGQIVAGVAQHSGWTTVRGSSSKGGRQALKEMITHLRRSKLAGHIVDGPRGPSGVVKSGVIRLAHAADAAIVPFTITAEKAWYFNSWDRFLLPKPFSKVSLRFGQMIRFERVKEKEQIERQRRQLEDIMRPALCRKNQAT